MFLKTIPVDQKEAQARGLMVTTEGELVVALPNEYVSIHFLRMISFNIFLI